MKKIILFGASDHCRYTIDIIENEQKYQIAGILDKTLSKGTLVDGYSVLGYLDDLKELLQNEDIHGGIVAVGDNYTRMTLAKEILSISPDFNFVNAIHSSVIVGKNTIIGKGCVIMAGVIVNNNCHVNDHCFLATKSSLDHDSTIRSYSSLSPGVTTGGRVEIGECTAIGIGASVLHYIKIGNDCVIGGNSLVNKNIDDNTVAYGIPAKSIKTRKPGDKYL